jgi:hypothetical protein
MARFAGNTDLGLSRYEFSQKQAMPHFSVQEKWGWRFSGFRSDGSFNFPLCLTSFSSDSSGWSAFHHGARDFCVLLSASV